MKPILTYPLMEDCIGMLGDGSVSGSNTPKKLNNQNAIDSLSNVVQKLFQNIDPGHLQQNDNANIDHKESSVFVFKYSADNAIFDVPNDDLEDSFLDGLFSIYIRFDNKTKIIENIDFEVFFGHKIFLNENIVFRRGYSCGYRLDEFLKESEMIMETNFEHFEKLVNKMIKAVV